jgi:hypothetical protein
LIFRVDPGVNTAYNGVKSLPGLISSTNYQTLGLTYSADVGETPTTEKCQTSVSIFSVDYDAPESVAESIQAYMKPIIGKYALS